jgi:large subunit ribosomal protein L21
MYAVVEIGGKQYKMSEGQIVKVERLNVEGKEVTFDKVLLIATENEIKVGKPSLDNVKITCEVLEKEVKGEKIIIFKWKRRKNMKRRRGYRQKSTVLLVKKIQL